MAIQCEICDSTNLLKQNGVFVCQDCGAKYTTEEIKKMVSGAAAAPAMSAPVVEKKEEKLQEEAEPAKDEELAQLLEWARAAYAEGNKGAGDTYLDKAVSKDSCNRGVMQFCIERGRKIDRSVLKTLIKQTPANEKAAAYEFAYDVLEKQRMIFFFPFAESDYEIIYGKNGTAKTLTALTVPELKMEGFWDVDRLLAIHFKSVIRWMNEYQLPEPTTEDGLNAKNNWGIVRSIFSTDEYLQEVDMLIPLSLKTELYRAFCKVCDTVLSGRFYIEVHVGYRRYEYPKVTEDLKVKSYHAINEYQPTEAEDWKKVKEVREKYKKLIQKIEADAAAAIAAQKAERNAAFWAEHPEEHSQLKSEKMLLEAKIRKLQNEHQADPQKKAMEQAQRDLTKYSWEMQNCGIFQGKRKKELAALIEETQNKEQECRAALEKNTIEYERSLKDLQNQLAEVDKKLSRE